MNERFWNLYARWYDKLSILEPYKVLQNQVMQGFGDLASNARILDAASGTGSLFMRLVKALPHATVVGIERSPAMMRQARRKLSRYRKKTGGGYGGTLFERDLNQPLCEPGGWPEGGFDAIASVNTLYALEDPGAFLAECRKLLAPGGRLILVNPWVPVPHKVLVDQLQQMVWGGSIRDIIRFGWNMPEIMAVYIANMIIAKRAKGKVLHFLPPDDLVILMEERGFRVLELNRAVYSDTCCLIIAE